MLFYASQEAISNSFLHFFVCFELAETSKCSFLVVQTLLFTFVVVVVVLVASMTPFDPHNSEIISL